MRWLIASLVVVSLAVGARTQARACPPAVRLEGDRALVAEVTPVLADRGISTAAGDCPALAVTLERRGKATLVSASPSDERARAREVTDVRTAATIIESWVRTDVEEPLLARRPADDLELPDGLVATAPAAARPGLQIVTLAETGLASDHTAWAGFQVGACAMVGRVCVGGRARLATVADGPGVWEAAMDREAVDALFDLDLPLRLGPLTLSSGIGVGLGWIHTHEEDLSLNAKQTAGLRAEPHLSLSIPLTRHVAFESTLSFELAQAVLTTTTARDPLPADPRLFGHLGLGLRFEGP